ncbi:MAG: hypothetical protein UY60_C0002G0050 [Parcubacteria group bacterium GW2011_GWB1_50_9]|uniref:Uncharacterized protein n=1 Tax=Candidatus Kaiserbacteria bacterium GW2011_GWC2_52_8b TaxID=1618676 RepID=A0A0G1XLK5_9BACT|nr:MAG: hypothetical protein UY60_C0002G0050 [Parcubacteria group bacterium GW2011_GWB1_50_9]KKW24975.1 MAG: hypothetical protein VE99_C0004G0012 [candidate division Kazan bacterium GW2011_GWC1_52_13]KKW31781.1 MAG: hypothetical protein UY74_C0007G0010 [Candidatus Kaiserbacteria bacterium GW2011_GWC2_52_8b]
MEEVEKKRVKIGLVGCGRWGQNHAKTIGRLACEFVGIADPDPAKADFAKGLGVSYYSDYRELLPRVDALLVAAPTALHFDIVQSALAEGKHVLVEKPMTLSTRQSAELVRLAHEKALVLSVGYLYRFHPVVRALKEKLAAGQKIHYITGRCIGGKNRLWADSGAIFNFGIHFFDILNFILDRRPASVFAERQNLLDPEREDSAMVNLIYPDFFASLELSCVHPEKARDFWVITDREKIYADLEKQEMRVYDFSIDAAGNASGSLEPRVPPIEKGDPLADEFSYFFRSLADHDPVSYDAKKNIGREDLATVHICEAALRSAVLGRKLAIEYIS